METLKKLCAKHYKNGWPDKDTVHSYIDIYEEILKPYRSTAKNVLEIGLMSGESLRMWSDYFSGKVFGIDCDVEPINGMADLKPAIKDGLNIIIGDAANPHNIMDYFNGIKFDVIIEDANHDIDQQIAIYNTLKPYLNKGGIYIIEDIQDIDTTRVIFDVMGGIVVDRRYVKGRYDDVLVIIRNP